jgi:hypothetical protein
LFQYGKGGERMVQDKSLDELKQITIDYYVNLQRIKKADKGNNPELEYQLKVYKNKLAQITELPRRYFLHPISSAKINIDVQM